MRSLASFAVLIWLLVGVLAAYQRGYFGEDRDVNCKTFADSALTVVAGPLNYFGVNPKIDCNTDDRPGRG